MLWHNSIKIIQEKYRKVLLHDKVPGEFHNKTSQQFSCSISHSCEFFINVWHRQSFENLKTLFLYTTIPIWEDRVPCARFCWHVVEVNSRSSCQSCRARRDATQHNALAATWSVHTRKRNTHEKLKMNL